MSTSWNGDLPRSYQDAPLPSSFSSSTSAPTFASGRPAQQPTIRHLTGLAAGDVPIGGIGTDGYAEVGLLDRLRRNPFVLVGAAVMLFLLVSHPGGARDGYLGTGGGDAAADAVTADKAAKASAVGTASWSSSSLYSSSSTSSSASAFGFYDKGAAPAGAESHGHGGGDDDDDDDDDHDDHDDHDAHTEDAHVDGDNDDNDEDDGDGDDDHIAVGNADENDDNDDSDNSGGAGHDGGDGDGGIGIAWLLAYPLSGATYVLKLASMFDPSHPSTSIGTNHILFGMEHRPIYDDMPDGPFYASFDDRGILLGSGTGDVEGKQKERQRRYVLTLTDCSGHCYSPCTPEQFLETHVSFDAGCRTTSWYGDDDRGKGRLIGLYDVAACHGRVTKAVHMVRDPLSNVVSRFKLHAAKPSKGRDLTSSNRDNNDKGRYEQNPGGFQEYCKDADAISESMEDRSKFFPPDVVALMKDVPCRDEFFKYVQWHNLAILETEYRALESHTVYYEEFDSSIGGADPAGAISGLRQFLGHASSSSASGADAEGEGSRPELFRSANMYLEYYKEEQRLAIWRLIEALAFPKTWDVLSRYMKSPPENIE